MNTRFSVYIREIFKCELRAIVRWIRGRQERDDNLLLNLRDLQDLLPFRTHGSSCSMRRPFSWWCVPRPASGSGGGGSRDDFAYDSENVDLAFGVLQAYLEGSEP